MSMSVKKIALGALAVAALGAGALAGAAYAAGGDSAYEMGHLHWHFKGPFGTYDRAAMRRGYQVYHEVCAACHQLEHLAFRHLGDKGAPFYDEEYPNPNENPLIKLYASEWEIADIDSDTGDPITRPGIPSDYFPPIFPNDIAAAASNGGAVPPDLSVIVAARNGGADYIYNLLTAYNQPVPHDVTLAVGSHYNPVFDGGAIAMAPPLAEDLIEYIDGTPATVHQMARDVTEFLAWSSDPKLEQRKTTGLMTMIYLLVLAVLMWFSYQKVWKNVEH